MDIRVSKLVEKWNLAQTEIYRNVKSSTEERTSREGETNRRSNGEEEGETTAENKRGGYRDADGAERENGVTRYLDARHIVTTNLKSDLGSCQNSGGSAMPLAGHCTAASPKAERLCCNYAVSSYK